MFKKKFILILLILSVVFAGAFVYQRRQTKKESAEQKAVETSKTQKDINWKTYRNEQFGFEFQYPQDLIIRENSFVSYYSKFNLEVVVKKGEYRDPAFLVNIVLPEFADHTFLGVGATTSTVTIDGVSGIKYEYEFEGLPEIAIVLPLGQYKVILGMEGATKPYEYEDTFNQILASFKFLNSPQ